MQDALPNSSHRDILDTMKQLPRLRRIWFVTQSNGIHNKSMVDMFMNLLIHTTTTVAPPPLEFILIYTSAADPGEICTYTKEHEDPLNGPPRDVWCMYEYGPILTTFDLETELRPRLERL
jgi:hypothetical protein